MVMQPSQSLGEYTLQYQGHYYPLNKPQIIIGSGQNCDIRIENNPQVLPAHARVISQPGRVFLQIGPGAVGWVNGVLASQQMLQDWDDIMLGDDNTRFTLLLNRYPTGGGQAMWDDATNQVNRQAM